jgi:hypothetical protein
VPPPFTPALATPAPVPAAPSVAKRKRTPRTPKQKAARRAAKKPKKATPPSETDWDTEPSEDEDDNDDISPTRQVIKDQHGFDLNRPYTRGVKLSPFDRNNTMWCLLEEANYLFSVLMPIYIHFLPLRTYAILTLVLALFKRFPNRMLPYVFPLTEEGLLEERDTWTPDKLLYFEAWMGVSHSNHIFKGLTDLPSSECCNGSANTRRTSHRRLVQPRHPFWVQC